MKTLITLLFFMTLMSNSWGQFTCPGFTFTYDNAGNRVKRQYVVCFAPDDGDVSVLNAVVKNNDGLQNSQTNRINLKAYPNPNNGVFQVVIENPLEHSMLDLYDFTGRKINTQAVETGSISMNVNNLAAGSYMIVYKNLGKILGQLKIIIE